MQEKREFKVVELFSGIGSQVEALRNLDVNVNIMNTCEWNWHTFMAYSIIHNMEGDESNVTLAKEDIVDKLIEIGISNDGKAPVTKKALQSFKEYTLKKIYATVESTKNLVDISRVKGEDLPNEIDLMTYSFPCQDLSNVGAFHGYNKGIDRDADNRSSLLWQVERILYERKEADMYLPHFLLMENVPSLNSARHRNNFEEWQRHLRELGYYNKQYLLNAKDFGLPQNRERLLMLSVFTDNDIDVEKEVIRFFDQVELSAENYAIERGKANSKLKDFLRTDYSKEKYYLEALECQPNNTISRRKIWEENVKLTDEKGSVRDIITSTLTTKQDRHPNSGNLKVDFNNEKAAFRYLTPRECFLLMGFKEDKYDKLLENNFEIRKNVKMFTRDNLIKMAGNSIAVNVLEAIFIQVIKLNERLFY